MKWKFWSKADPTIAAHQEKTKEKDSRKKPPRPKDLPQMIGKHLVVVLNHDPDWVWSLKAVRNPIEETKGVFRIRIFDPNSTIAEGATITHYDSLDNYPTLILFTGWLNKSSGEFELQAETHQQVA